MASDGIGPKGPGGGLGIDRTRPARSATRPRASSSSPASSSGSTSPRALASSFPTTGCPTFFCTSRACDATASRSPMRARASWSRCCSARRGLQAFRILSMDESTAVHPAQMPPPRTHVTRHRRPAGSNVRRSSGSIGCAASASSPAARAPPTSSCTWRRCAATALTELRPGQFVLVRFGPGPEGPDGRRGPAGRRPPGPPRTDRNPRRAAPGSRRACAASECRRRSAARRLLCIAIARSRPVHASPPWFALAALVLLRAAVAPVRPASCMRSSCSPSRSRARPACTCSRSRWRSLTTSRRKGLMFRRDLPEGQRHAVRFRARAAGRASG